MEKLSGGCVGRIMIPFLEFDTLMKYLYTKTLVMKQIFFWSSRKYYKCRRDLFRIL